MKEIKQVKKYNFSVTENMAERIENYRWEKRVKSVNLAITQLVEKGLEVVKNEKVY